jgi:zinc and cadmium transporter
MEMGPLMTLLSSATGAVLASGVVACAALSARLVVWMDPARLRVWLPWMQAIVAGLLLGDALLHMLPEAMERGISAGWMGECLALGTVGLLSVECIVRAMNPTPSTAAFARMDVVADFLHHLVDGIVIGASFMMGPALGIVVALAIMAHEIPREAGNAGVLVAGGYAPASAFGLSIATTVAIPLGAVGMVAIGHAPIFIGTSLALAAGSTIYLAIGDVLPSLWLGLGSRNRFTPALGVAAGLLFMWAAALFDHSL